MSNSKPLYAVNIRRLRKAKRWTQEQLGMKINYSGRMVSRWEAGAVEPNITALIKLAALFGVTVDDILTGQQ